MQTPLCRPPRPPPHQVRATFFGHAPSFHGPTDFETISSGWLQGGRVGTAFEALATETSRQREEASSRQQIKREKSSQRLKARQQELRAWLGELGLGDL